VEIQILSAIERLVKFNRSHLLEERFEGQRLHSWHPKNAILANSENNRAEKGPLTNSCIEGRQLCSIDKTPSSKERNTFAVDKRLARAAKERV